MRTSHRRAPHVADGFDAATPVALRIKGLNDAHELAAAAITPIDENNGNAFTKWRQLGDPQTPSPPQIAMLHDAAALRAAALEPSAAVDDRVDYRLNLLGQSAALIEIPLKRR